MPPDIRGLLEKNAELIKENNKLLRQVRKHQVYGTTLTFLWYALLIGAPFALYFYVLEPYFAAFGASYDTFSIGMKEIPGYKQFFEALEAYRSK